MGGDAIRPDPTHRHLHLPRTPLYPSPAAPAVGSPAFFYTRLQDVLDCTGAGDVACEVAALQPDGTLHGHTGRTLKLGADWENPSGEYRVGSKAGFEIFPRGLVTRLKEEGLKEWRKGAGAAEAEVTRLLAAWHAAHPGPAPAGPAALREREDLEARQKQLRELKHDPAGPVYDVVSWHDGETYRVAVDVGCTGDLSGCTPLAPYAVEHRHGSFGEELQLNYCVAVYDGGSTVNICVDAGSHATHVAGIIGAYRPDQPELNGMAPGAQIVSLKIGDARMGSMETGAALVRALAEVVKHKAHLINLSYGEATGQPNAGLFVDLAEEVVHKHGVIFVSSAGNSGPALTTAGAPGATSDCILSVGAYVASNMMETQCARPAFPSPPTSSPPGHRCNACSRHCGIRDQLLVDLRGPRRRWWHRARRTGARRRHHVGAQLDA